MNTIKAVLVDDEIAALDVLEYMLNENFNNIEIIGKFNSAKEGLLFITEEQPDVVFLDIDMPWMNGLEFVKIISNIETEVIFVTAHNELAVKAIKTSALDFITKPAIVDDLKEAIRGFEEKRRQRKDKEIYKFLSSQVDAIVKNKLEKIALPSSKGISIFELSKICGFEADNIYSKVFLEDGTDMIVFKPLKEIESILEEENFFRCHKSYIINLKMVTSVSKGEGGKVHLSNEISIPVARSRRNELLRYLQV